ncbi:MAG: hypothetical protein QG588_1572 [Candidatus Poribacteria bacterium]|nr:hypothetical protein [Candidatus Poribacteria bacterium]
MTSKWLFLILILFIVSGCGFMSMFTPEMALDKYQRVGVINFSSESKGNLNEIMTQEFLNDVRKASKKTQIIELGDESKILESTQQTELNAVVINTIGKKNNLDAIITGHIVINEIRPQIKSIRSVTGKNDVAGNALRFKPDNTPTGYIGYRTMRAKFDVDASLSVSLIETTTVRTVWTGSAREEKTMTPVNIYSGKNTTGVFFDKKDPKDAYGGLTKALSQDIISKLRIK